MGYASLGWWATNGSLDVSGIWELGAAAGAWKRVLIGIMGDGFRELGAVAMSLEIGMSLRCP